MSLFIRNKLSNISNSACSTSVVAQIKTEIDRFKEDGFLSGEQPLTSNAEGQIKHNPPVILDLNSKLGEFLASKSAEGISHRYIQQLKLRIGHFVGWHKKSELNGFTPKLALEYRDYLLSEGRSYKTNHLYLSAITLFFSWCVNLEYIDKNPFENIKLGKKPNKKPHEQRKRWKRKELKLLFNEVQCKYDANTNHSSRDADYWVPHICLYSGLRINEICQLKVSSLKQHNGIAYFNVNSADDDGELKTANAYRKVPIHSKLLTNGLLGFIERQRKSGKALLFEDKTAGAYGEFGANVRTRFNRMLTKLGFEAGSRPTIYSLRHTFIDELQQLEVSENIVADLVGHSKKSITFGRYGKTVNLKLLKEKVELIPPDLT